MRDNHVPPANRRQGLTAAKKAWIRGKARQKEDQRACLTLVSEHFTRAGSGVSELAC